MMSLREMALSVEFDAFLADDMIFDNKTIINYYLKHNYHIFVLHTLSF
jgi:hypothetical protein